MLNHDSVGLVHSVIATRTRYRTQILYCALSNSLESIRVLTLLMNMDHSGQVKLQNFICFCKNLLIYVYSVSPCPTQKKIFIVLSKSTWDQNIKHRLRAGQWRSRDGSSITLMCGTRQSCLVVVLMFFAGFKIAESL